MESSHRNLKDSYPLSDVNSIATSKINPTPRLTGGKVEVLAVKKSLYSKHELNYLPFTRKGN